MWCVNEALSLATADSNISTKKNGPVETSFIAANNALTTRKLDVISSDCDPYDGTIINHWKWTLKRPVANITWSHVFLDVLCASYRAALRIT